MNNKVIIRQLLILELKVYRKSPMYIFLSLILSVVLCLIWLAFREGDPFVIPSTVSCLTITNTTIVYLRSLVNQKQTQFFRRLRYNRIRPYVYAFSTMLFNLIVNTFGVLIIFGIGLSFPGQWKYLNVVNILSFIPAYFLFWLTCILFSYFVFISIQKTVVVQIIVTAFHLITYNAMGCTFPFYAIVTNDFLNGFLYIMPNRYAINLMHAIYAGAWDLNYVDIYYNGKFNLNFRIGSSMVLIIMIVIMIVLILFGLIALRYWISHKKRVAKIDYFAERRAYLQKIKHAHSLEEVEKLKSTWEKNNK